MGYPKHKKPEPVQINLPAIASELTCRYCGRGFSSLAKIRGHLGQCVKRGAFLKKLERGVIVIVHKKYFHIMPKSLAALQHIEKFLDLYKERNGQPELWEKDINTFIGALTALHMEKKLSFEMLEKEEAIKLSHSVVEVYTDGSLQDLGVKTPMLGTTILEIPQKPQEEHETEPKPLIKLLREKKRRANMKEVVDNLKS